jgi:hypothetical protein
VTSVHSIVVDVLTRPHRPRIPARQARTLGRPRFAKVVGQEEDVPMTGSVADSVLAMDLKVRVRAADT